MQLCYSCSLESIRLPLQSICTAEEEAIERADQLEAKVNKKLWSLPPSGYEDSRSDLTLLIL